MIKKDILSGIKIYRLIYPDSVPRTVQKYMNKKRIRTKRTKEEDWEGFPPKRRIRVGRAIRFQNGTYGIWIDPSLKGIERKFVREHEKEHVRMFIQGEERDEMRCNEIASKKLRKRGVDERILKRFMDKYDPINSFLAFYYTGY